jgi:hypothetical protein
MVLTKKKQASQFNEKPVPEEEKSNPTQKPLLVKHQSMHLPKLSESSLESTQTKRSRLGRVKQKANRCFQKGKKLFATNNEKSKPEKSKHEHKESNIDITEQLNEKPIHEKKSNPPKRPLLVKHQSMQLPKLNENFLGSIQAKRLRLRSVKQESIESSIDITEQLKSSLIIQKNKEQSDLSEVKTNDQEWQACNPYDIEESSANKHFLRSVSDTNLLRNFTYNPPPKRENASPELFELLSLNIKTRRRSMGLSTKVAEALSEEETAKSV